LPKNLIFLLPTGTKGQPIGGETTVLGSGRLGKPLLQGVRITPSSLLEIFIWDAGTEGNTEGDNINRIAAHSG
jgi:hypothetical protein